MDYLSIKEFSMRAGISRSAVYQQLDGRLKPYVIKDKGKRFISVSALDEFYKEEQPGDENISHSSENSSYSSKNISDISENSSYSSQVKSSELMTTMVEMLQKELDRKDALLLEERKRVDELNKQLADAYKQISEMGQKAQYITGVSETNKLMDKQQELAQEPTEREQESAEAEHPAVPPKKFIGRLFSWLK